MKVIVSPNGEVIFETENTTQALDMIKALRNGTAPSKPAKRGPYKKRTTPVEQVEEIPLSPRLVETWEWLVANDSESGVRVPDIARGMGLRTGTVTWRCNQLIDKGLAHRIGRGRYRPGESA